MPVTTKYTLMEQVQQLLGGQSAATRATPAYIKKLIEQVANRKLKAAYFNETLAAGENIPNGLVIATYTKIPVERYGDRSRAFLPAIPKALPRGMGIYSVRPHIKTEYLANTELAATAYSGTIVKLVWKPIQNATGYVLQRSTGPGFTSPVTLYTGNGVIFSDENLQPLTPYYYRVKGVSDDYMDSSWQIVSCTTLSA